MCLVARGIAQVQLGLVQRQAQSRQLVVDFEIDALIRLNLDDLQPECCAYVTCEKSILSCLSHDIAQANAC